MLILVKISKKNNWVSDEIKCLITRIECARRYLTKVKKKI